MRLLLLSFVSFVVFGWWRRVDLLKFGWQNTTTTLPISIRSIPREQLFVDVVDGFLADEFLRRRNLQIAQVVPRLPLNSVEFFAYGDNHFLD